VIQWSARRKKTCRTAIAPIQAVRARAFAASAFHTTVRQARCRPAISAKKQNSLMTGALKHLSKTGKAGNSN